MSRSRAESELEAVAAAIEGVKRQLEELEARARRLATYLEVDAELRSGRMHAPVAEAQSGVVSTPPPRSSGGLGAEIRRLVRDRLVSVGQPQSTAALVEWLTTQGVNLKRPGKEDRATADLSAILSRDKATFVASRKYGWSLQEWSSWPAEPPGPVGQMDQAASERPSSSSAASFQKDDDSWP